MARVEILNLLDRDNIITENFEWGLLTGNFPYILH
jgi:hypothetical protein